MIYLIIFIIGLSAGSFLNCLIYRLEEEKSFLKGRSYCPHCKQVLKWQDLIPVLSFLILRGKCRYCQKPISLQYPLVELITGLLFVLIFNFSPALAENPAVAGQFSIFSAFGGIPLGWDNFQTLINLCFLFSVFCFLIIIFVFDLKHFIIPDKIIYPAIGIVFLYRLFEILNFFPRQGGGSCLGGTIFNYLISAVLAGAFFLFVVLITKGRGMGIGDIKLAFLMGLFLGFPDILVALFFAFIIGAIIGIGLILMKKKTLKSEVPFGPFLVAGTFIAFFWGQTFIDWYFQLFIFNFII